MIIDNKIRRTISGPYIFMGLSFLIPGFALLPTKEWVFGVIMLIIGGFVLFSYSGVEIDTERRKIKAYNKYFGFIKTGKWKSISNYLGVTIIPVNKVQSIYSRSNRINSSAKNEFNIYLVDKTKRPALAIKKCKTHEAAQDSLDEFAIWLKMTVFSIKN